jgi:hypothetical protein
MTRASDATFPMLLSGNLTQIRLLQKWMMIPIALAAVIDMVIAVALVIVLHRSRTGIQR